MTSTKSLEKVVLPSNSSSSTAIPTTHQGEENVYAGYSSGGSRPSSPLSQSPPLSSPREEGSASANLCKSDEEDNWGEDVFASIAHRSSNKVTTQSFTKFDPEEDWISVKMDDRVFTTTRSTLTLDKESVLSVMFQTDSPFHLPRDMEHPSKPYLLDRNPKYFEPILNYLRTGEMILDPGVNIKGVWLEAKYFNIQDLIEELDMMLKEQEDKMLAKQQNEAELSREDVVKALITSTSAVRLRFQGLNLSGLDLSKLDLTGVNFSRSNLQNVNFSHSNLEGADLRKCLLPNVNMTSAKLGKARMSRAKMQNINLTNAALVEADLSFCDMTGSCLRYADLGGTNLTGALLVNADLTGANLKKALLKGAVLTGVDRASTNLPMGGVIGK